MVVCDEDKCVCQRRVFSNDHICDFFYVLIAADVCHDFFNFGIMAIFNLAVQSRTVYTKACLWI